MGLMNDKRGSLFFAAIIGIFVFMAGMLFIQHLNDGVISARAGMSCSDASNISYGNKLACLIVDAGLPTLFVFIVSVAFGWVADLVS